MWATMCATFSNVLNELESFDGRNIEDSSWIAWWYDQGRVRAVAKIWSEPYKSRKICKIASTIEAILKPENADKILN